jgi:hypothetical protein
MFILVYQGENRLRENKITISLGKREIGIDSNRRKEYLIFQSLLHLSSLLICRKFCYKFKHSKFTQSFHCEMKKYAFPRAIRRRLRH